MELIDKSALVEEIEKVIEEPAPPYDSQCRWEDGQYCGLYKAESIIDTLEVKEVDLDNELDFVKDAYYYFTSDERSSMKKVARHFFELGLNVKKGEQL